MTRRYGQGMHDLVRAMAPSGIDRALDVAGSGVLPQLVELAGSPERVLTVADVAGRLYGIDPASIDIYRLPSLHVVRISFPRPVSLEALRDRDLHMGQHHVPRGSLHIPGRA